MDAKEDQIAIKKCLNEIEQILNWGDSANWQSDTFEELSNAIHKKTGVVLSPTTLKRVWGRINYKGSPSITTLNTLAKFADFENWRDFLNSQDNRKPFSLLSKLGLSKKHIPYTIAISLCLLLLLLIFSMRNIYVDQDFDQVTFKSRVIVDGLPNSVVFDFTLPEDITTDNIHIQQFWDPDQTIKIKEDQTQATGQYYYPGYFRAKLVIDDQIIKEHDLFIKSDSWLGTIDYEPIPKYITDLSSIPGKMRFSQNHLDEISESEDPLMSSFHYVTDLDSISGDDFILQSRIKNVYSDKWAVCQKSTIVVMGTKSAHIIPFSIPGCISDLYMMLSEQGFNGKEYDLSKMGVDFSTYKDVKIKATQKTLEVFIDDDRKFSKQYKSSIGRIVGIRYRFIGAGEVDYVSLKEIGDERFIIEEEF